jgi:hypothetical protein
MPFTCHPSGECPGPKVPLAPNAGRFADALWAALALVPRVADVLSRVAGAGTGGVYGREVVGSLRAATVLVRAPVYEAGTTRGLVPAAVWV